MSVIYPLISTITSGEITPRQKGNTASDIYAGGLDYCENFEVSPNGSIEMRSGTRYVTTINEQDAVLKRFERGVNDDVIVVIGDANIQCWDTNGRIVSSPELLDDPKWNNSFDNDWETDLGNGEITPVQGIGVICGSKQNTLARVKQTIPIGSGADTFTVSCSITCLSIPPSFLEYDGNAFIRVKDINDNFVVRYEELSPNISEARSFGVGVTLTLSVNIDAAAMFADTALIEFGVDNIPNDFGFGRVLFSEMTVTKDGTLPQPVQFATPQAWRGQLDKIQTATDSASGLMIMTCPNSPIYALDFDKGADAWDFYDFADSNDFTPEDFWLDDYPSCCAFFQGRLWLAGSPARPSTIWASRVWDYDNFVVAADYEVDPDAALEFELSTNARIQWLDDLKLLLIGTDKGVVVARSNSGVLKFNDFFFSTEQKWPCARIQPSDSGQNTFFITADNSRVRNLYDGGDLSNSYRTLDVSVTAEHLLQQRIIDIQYQELPDYHISLLTQQGAVIGCTYFEQGGINAWYRTSTYNRVRSIAISAVNDGQSLWFLVGEAETGSFNLEYKPATNKAGYNLDSHVVALSDAAGLVTGLDHLNDITCQVVKIDGGKFTLLGEYTPTAGEITLPYYGFNSTVIVGIPYTATMRTLKLENTNRAGTAQTSKRRFNEVYLRLYESSVPKINGERPQLRRPETLLDESEYILTDDISLRTIGYNDGVIEITQDKPLPTKIAAIFGKAKGSTT